MLCPKCGNDVSDHAKFCGQCGYQFTQASAEEEGDRNNANATDAETENKPEHDFGKSLRAGLIGAGVALVLVAGGFAFASNVILPNASNSEKEAVDAGSDDASDKEKADDTKANEEEIDKSKTAEDPKDTAASASSNYVTVDAGGKDVFVSSKLGGICVGDPATGDVNTLVLLDSQEGYVPAITADGENLFYLLCGYDGETEIRRSSLSSDTSVAIYTTSDTVTDLRAIDGLVYCVVQTSGSSHSLLRMNSDGSGCEEIANISSLDGNASLETCITGDAFYYTECNYSYFANRSIHKVTFNDGADRVIYSSDQENLTSLHGAGDRIYFARTSSTVCGISSIKTDGSDYQTYCEFDYDNDAGDFIDLYTASKDGVVYAHYYASDFGGALYDATADVVYSTGNGGDIALAENVDPSFLTCYFTSADRVAIVSNSMTVDNFGIKAESMNCDGSDYVKYDTGYDW